MIIRIEPRELLMYSVHLIFNLQSPDAEDTTIKAYLAEHQRQPKRVENLRYQERDCQVWSFGGCYLGPHLDVIVDMQRKAVQQELLTRELAPFLAKLRPFPEGKREKAIATLAEELDRQSRFATNEKGDLAIALDPDTLGARFAELAGLATAKEATP